MGVLGEDALAVGVQLLGDAADAGFLQVVGGGEGEGIEAAGFDIDRTIFEEATCAHCPTDM